MPLAKFKCPVCGRKVQALPSSVPMHECPKNKNRVTVFLKEKEQDQ